MSSPKDKLLVTTSVIERLKKFPIRYDGDNDPCVNEKLSFIGCVHGILIEELSGVPVILNVCGNTFPSKDVDDTKNQTIEFLNDIFPVGIDSVGVVYATEEEGDFAEEPDSKIVSHLIDQLPDSLLDLCDPVIFLQHKGALKGYVHKEGHLKELTVEAVDVESVEQRLTVIRLRGKTTLTCALNESEVTNVFKYLLEKVSSPYGAFHLENSDVHFLHTLQPKNKPCNGWIAKDMFQEDYTEDCKVTNLCGDPSAVTVDQLSSYLRGRSEPVEDGGDEEVKRKTPQASRRETLNFRLLLKMCGDAVTSKTLNCAPIVNYESRDIKVVRIPLKLDTLGVVCNATKVVDLMDILKGSAQRQIQELAGKVLSEFRMRNTISLPEVFHLKPKPFGHLITIVYTKSLTCGNFAQFRKHLHQMFLLECNRPFFRRMNRYIFMEDRTPPAALIDVHLSLKPPGIGGVVALVQGHYSYHHYLQDQFNDEGWGCAYRSLQTIISWFRYQGYVATDIPTHQQIQKCLVDIGDKEPSFVGSRQWIGSMEVGFVLEKSCSVKSKFISVNSGAELATKGDDLLFHFQTQGTPIMIGGGVLAHTILGVAMDDVSDEIRFLVLDPHYTGPDWSPKGTSNVGHIQSKGWVSWKGPKFWKSDSFYNLCMPQRPAQW